MTRRTGKKSINEKVGLILSLTERINDKVDQQNTDIVLLQQQVKALQMDLDDMRQKTRNQAILAGGVGGGLVAIGIEFTHREQGDGALTSSSL